MIKSNKIKGLTIRQVTWILTSIVTFIALLLGIQFAFLHQWEFHFVGLAIVMFLNFIVIRFFVEKYLFHRIKLIYKLISDTKRDVSIKESGSENIENLNDHVLEWAETTKEELASLKSLEEYRKNFLGNISHELKTPIFTIQGYLHTLLDGGIYDPKINIDFLRRAAENTDRLQNIVEDLETISKLESEQEALDFTKFNIRELCQNIMSDLKGIANQKSISLKFKENSSPNYMVYADKDAILQVLNNLIVNSIKYGRDGGITKIGFHEFGDDILVEISDNGIGIDEKHHKHLFDRFYRVDSSRSRKQGGSGLGLSIVKHIIEAHGQTINVRSTSGLGSTFSFTLKAAK